MLLIPRAARGYVAAKPGAAEERVGGTGKRTPPDFEAIHREHRQPGLTLELSCTSS